MARVIVVDDDPETALLVQVTFEDAGHEAVVISDPAVLQPTLHEQGADALVLDIMLPGASGYDILAAIRAEPETAHLPVLLLSSLTDSAHRIHGLRQGAADYLTKPFEPAELLLRVEHMLSSVAPDDAALEGNLQDFPFWELLQSLHQGRRTGTLEMPEVSGRMTIRNGAIVRAEWNALKGHSAALALSEVERGRFRFHPKESVEASSLGASPIAISSLLMTAAVLRDELERRKEHLPPAETPLVAQPAEIPPTPETFEGIPVGIVFVEVLDNPGRTLLQLLKFSAAAPQQVKLATAWLCQHGLLSPQGEKGVGHTASVGAPSAPRVAATPAGPRHLLFLCQPESWEKLLQRVSSQPSQGPWTELHEQLSLRHGGTAHLEKDNAKVSLHVQILNNATRGRVGAILPLCSGVAIWLGGSDSLDGIEDLLRKVEALHTSPKAVLLAPTENLYRQGLQRVHGSPVWQVASSVPEDLRQLVDLLS